MQQHLQAIVTVLSLVNPLICGAMFAQIEAGQTSATRLADATKAALAVLVILVLAALVGARVLHIFGVSLDAFSVAGGGVLAWIGFSMLRGNSAPVPNAARDQKRSLTPLILFAASPGTITGVITLAVVHTKLLLPVTALLAVAVATVVMWIIMVLVGREEGTHEGGGFLRNTATRFMGLIVIAMGTQFALTGLRDFFAAHPLRILNDPDVTLTCERALLSERPLSHQCYKPLVI
jgi:multiple antibiotic resistance protein